MKHGSLGIHLTIDADRISADWIENRKEDYNVKESLSWLYIQGLDLKDSGQTILVRPKILADKNSMPFLHC